MTKIEVHTDWPPWAGLFPPRVPSPHCAPQIAQCWVAAQQSLPSSLQGTGQDCGIGNGSGMAAGIASALPKSPKAKRLMVDNRIVKTRL
jgi:hypothetical protein